MPIYNEHKEYQSVKERWQRMSDVCDGEDVVKQAKTRYLPKPNVSNDSKENDEWYQNYLKRAVFAEVTKDTLDRYAGQAFKDDPILMVGAFFEYLAKNANGGNVSLFQLAQKGFIALMQYGRCGYFVDYPYIDHQPSLLQMEIQKIRPQVHFYPPQNIINWRIIDNRLTMVILQEFAQVVDDTDHFSEKQVKQWRYLGLDDIGFFVEVWQEISGGLAQIGERIYPRHAGGYWQQIPFVVVGSDTNDFSTQSIPLESLAKVNLAHYRNSADYEDSVFRCGQVQPFMSGVNQQLLDYYADKGVMLGSANCLLMEQGTFGFAQAGANVLAGEAMDKKYALMMELGAKLATQSHTKTATQASQDNANQNSIASMCVANLNEAINDVLAFCHQYVGSNEPYNFKVKQEFGEVVADVALLQTLMSYQQAGLVHKSAVFDYLRKHNLISPEMGDDELLEVIEGELLTGGLNA